MSLFKNRDWWWTKPNSEEEYDRGCLCVANVDNDPSGQVKIITGSFQGLLRIYLPRGRDFKPEDLLLEQQLGAPILHLAVGRFISNLTSLSLAVLHPRKLVVYNVVQSAGFGEGLQSSFYSFEKKYEHHLEHTSFNMCFGPFGGVNDRDFICVQSMDGVLAFFEQENFAFIRYLHNFIIPGPICYFSKLDSIITANSQMEVECYKYHVLATSSSERNEEDREGIAARKKLQVEWSINIGEQVVDMFTARLSRTLQASQSDIVVLGERSLFCLKENGAIRTQKRLDYNPICATPYIVEDSKDTYWHNLMIVTHNSAIKVYKDTQLIWTSGLSSHGSGSVPVKLDVGSFGNIPGMIVSLDDHGYLSCSYLGTDPATTVVNVQSDVKDFNYDDMDEELKRLQGIIREATSSTKSEPPDAIRMEVTLMPEEGLRSVTDDSVTIKYNIILGYSGTEPIQNVTITVDTPAPFTCRQSSIAVASIKGGSSTPLVIPLYIESHNTRNAHTGEDHITIPPSLTVLVVASGNTPSGEPRCSQFEVQLPLWAACQVLPPVKSSDSLKYVLDTNKEAVEMVTLFQDIVHHFEGSEGSFSGGPNAISFRYHHGGPDVTIIVSKNTGRYRVQSSSFEAIWLIAAELTERLKLYFSGKSSTEPIKITVQEELPLGEYFKYIDKHFACRLALVNAKEELDKKAQQFRAVQKRLLVRYKDKNAPPLENLDWLLQETHNEIVDVANTFEKHDSALKYLSNQLACATNLILILARYKYALDELNYHILRSHLTSHVQDNSEQGWEECVTAALEYLVRNSLASNAQEASTVSNIKFPDDTNRLKKLISLIADKLAKGSVLYKVSTKKRAAGKKTQ